MGKGYIPARVNGAEKEKGSSVVPSGTTVLTQGWEQGLQG